MTNSSADEVERRKAFRIDMEKELVDITWQDKDGIHQQKKIVCLDFSRSGAKLDCDHAIPADTSVSLVFNAKNPKSQKLNAKVIRCIKQDTGWFEVALKLDPPSK